MNKNMIIKKIKDYFADKDEIIAVYLFGSLSKENYKKDSDIDIALMIKDRENKVEEFDYRLKVINELEKLLNSEVDIIIFSHVNLKMQHQILSGELILTNDNRRRVEIEKSSLKRYLDMKYFYEIYEDKLGRGFDIG
ncbi:MAG: type VII toxin-antitoxin system MntA family adenylyltransferase antitoxin [Bacillota bacterium]